MVRNHDVNTNCLKGNILLHEEHLYNNMVILRLLQLPVFYLFRGVHPDFSVNLVIDKAVAQRIRTRLPKFLGVVGPNHWNFSAKFL